jgi:hypothetical protein
MRLAHIEKDGDSIKFCNIRNQEWNMWINSDIFIKAIISGKEEYDFNIVLNFINEISLILFYNSGKVFIHEFNFIDSLFHHSTKPANREYYDDKNSYDIYYYKGINYKYEYWLNLPERIREIRELKLKLI